MNKNIWSADDNFSVQSDVDKTNKLNTIVHQSPTNEKCTAYPRIEEESLKNVFPKIADESNLSKRMNLANFLSIESPKLVHFSHPPIDTNNVGSLIDVIVATRIENSKGIWSLTERDDRMAQTHDIENISENIA